jgi:hypothetical protein
VLAKSKQFLLLIRHPPCYSSSHDVLNTTTHKPAQITQIRHEPFYKQLGVNTNQILFFYEEIVADITTRNEELKIAWSHHIWFYFCVFLHLLLFTKRYRNKKCIECVFLPKQKIFGQQQFKTNTMYFVENAMYRSTEKESSCRSRNQQTLLFPHKIILINFLTVLQ